MKYKSKLTSENIIKKIKSHSNVQKTIGRQDLTFSTIKKCTTI